MYEIIMLFAFLYAATCQLFPRANRGGKPDLSKKKPNEANAREWAKGSVSKQKRGHGKPVGGSNRKPALYVQQGRLRLASKGAYGIKLKRIY